MGWPKGKPRTPEQIQAIKDGIRRRKEPTVPPVVAEVNATKADADPTAHKSGGSALGRSE